MPVVVDIADAVATELIGSGLFPSGADTVSRQYRPRVDLQTLKDLKVTVVPRSVALSGGTRGAQQVDCQVDVALQQKLTDETDAVITPLMDLVEQTVDFLTRRQLATVPDAKFVGIRNEPIYAVEHLDELRVFTTVITVTYRVMR